MALDASWLAYARHVLDADDHTPSCAATGGGSLVRPEGALGDLRWPGYLGHRYHAGGVLLVANVHRNFDSGRPGAPPLSASVFREVAAATDRFRAAAPSDDEANHAYLEATRQGYLQGFERWKVGHDFGHVLGYAGLEWDEVAYTNVAKCQQVVGTATTAGALQRVCLRRFALDDLLCDLEVGFVVTCSAVARDHLAAGDVPWRYFPQRGWSHRELQEIGLAMRSEIARSQHDVVD